MINKLLANCNGGYYLYLTILLTQLRHMKKMWNQKTLEQVWHMNKNIKSNNFYSWWKNDLRENGNSEKTV